VELLLEDDGTRLLVRLEQGLDGDIQCACVLIGLHGEVEDSVVDRVVHPPANARVRLRPHGISWARGHRAVDVAEQPILAAEGGKEGFPFGEVGALEAEVDRHMLLHVDDSVGGEEDRGKSLCTGSLGGHGRPLASLALARRPGAARGWMATA
jgi:hypothetical protein